MDSSMPEGQPVADTREQHLSKVLGPMHIWALGVGIVLVGEFMGWNFTVAKGGSLGSIIACWIIGLLYISLVMLNTEIGSVMPEAGGQYAMAKYLLGPLAAFNVGLMLVFEYVMLEAADALVVGAILQSVNPEIQSLPFVILTLLVLTYLNYRGVYATLTCHYSLGLYHHSRLALRYPFLCAGSEPAALVPADQRFAFRLDRHSGGLAVWHLVLSGH